MDWGPSTKHKVLEQYVEILVDITQFSICKQDKSTPIHVGFTGNKKPWEDVSQNYTIFFTFEFTHLSINFPLLMSFKP